MSYAATLSRRIKLLAEILSTERTYVISLHTLVHTFIRTLENFALQSFKPLPPSLSVVFSNIDQLLVLHTQLLRDLNEHVDEEEAAFEKHDANPTFTHSSVASIFLKFAGLFSLYAQYGANYSTALQVIEELSESDDDFAAVIAVAESKPESNCSTISSFLITPIQRVPRYLLLLNELLRQTPTEDQCECSVCQSNRSSSGKPAAKNAPVCRYQREAARIKEAVQSVDAAAKVINEAIRKHDNRVALAELETHFSSPMSLVADNRRIVKTGTLRKLDRRSNETEYVFHLFNDQLMYSEDTPTGFKWHRTIPIDKGFRVENAAELGFNIHSAAKSFLVLAEDEADKSSWISTIQSVIDENSASAAAPTVASVPFRQRNNTSIVAETLVIDHGDIAPVWSPDSQSDKCVLCETEFSLFNRRHHCRRCGILVCDACSPHRHSIANIDNGDLVRVCNKCDQQLVELQAESFLAAAFGGGERTRHSRVIVQTRSGMDGRLVDIQEDETIPETIISSMSFYPQTSPTNSKASVSPTSAYSSNSIAGQPTELSVRDRVSAFQQKVDDSLQNLQAPTHAPPPPPPPKQNGSKSAASAAKTTTAATTAPTTTVANKPDKARLQVMINFLVSERVYINSLNILSTLFAAPLMQKFNSEKSSKRNSALSQLLSSASSTYSNVPSIVMHSSVQLWCHALEQVLNLNKQLIGRLEASVEQKNSDLFGDVFFQYASFTKVYTSYAEHVHDASYLLNQTPEFTEFRKSREADSFCEMRKLDNLMMEPLARLTRYLYFVAMLLKATPAEHADNTQLEEAKQVMRSTLENVNKAAEKSEQQKKIQALEAQFTGNVKLVKQGRSIVRSGNLEKIDRQGNPCQYLFHLFSDILTYSETTALGLKLHRMIDLSGLSVLDQDSDRNEFVIVTTAKSFVVRAEDEFTKRSWMKDILNTLATLMQESNDISPMSTMSSTSSTLKARSSLTPNSAAAPVWASDSGECQICNKGFSLFRRKHHCRACGLLVCGDCSEQTRLLTHIDVDSRVRVCDRCAESIEDTQE